jgi:hypothetical protein
MGNNYTTRETREEHIISLSLSPSQVPRSTHSPTPPPLALYLPSSPLPPPPPKRTFNAGGFVIPVVFFRFFPSLPPRAKLDQLSIR